jgi:protoheme IX farnesyltransferase|tara:strand:+ start:835 stop:1692 length:858 start_codon:yes stop_codon:yes gene_type:complete
MEKLRALVSLSKPNIILSVGLTGLTGMVLANKSLPDFRLIFFTLLSLILSAAGAAIINNLIEQDRDKLMERLSKRVESLNLIGPRNLTIIASFLTTFSLGISFFLINSTNFIFTLLAILSYTIYYTLFLKRSSPFGTVLGGIPGALPVLIGFSSVDPHISISYMDGIIMFIFMMLWQPPHFWLLAQYQADDYKKAGFPVMPLIYGKKFTNYLIMIYSLSLLPFSLFFWFNGSASNSYAVSAIILGLSFLYIVYKSFKDNTKYKSAFLFSILYMLLIHISLIINIA